MLRITRSRMLAHRRMLPLLLVGLATAPMPACLPHISGMVAPPESIEQKAPSSSDFASFPKRPGEVVRLNPGPSPIASKPPAEPKAEAKADPIAAIPPITDPALV